MNKRGRTAIVIDRRSWNGDEYAGAVMDFSGYVEYCDHDHRSLEAAMKCAKALTKATYHNVQPLTVVKSA